MFNPNIPTTFPIPESPLLFKRQAVAEEYGNLYGDGFVRLWSVNNPFRGKKKKMGEKVASMRYFTTEGVDLVERVCRDLNQCCYEIIGFTGQKDDPSKVRSNDTFYRPFGDIEWKSEKEDPKALDILGDIVDACKAVVLRHHPTATCRPIVTTASGFDGSGKFKNSFHLAMDCRVVDEEGDPRTIHLGDPVREGTLWCADVRAELTGKAYEAFDHVVHGRTSTLMRVLWAPSATVKGEPVLEARRLRPLPGMAPLSFEDSLITFERDDYAEPISLYHDVDISRDDLVPRLGEHGIFIGVGAMAAAFASLGGAPGRVVNIHWDAGNRGLVGFKAYTCVADIFADFQLSDQKAYMAECLGDGPCAPFADIDDIPPGEFWERVDSAIEAMNAIFDVDPSTLDWCVLGNKARTSAHLILGPDATTDVRGTVPSVAAWSDMLTTACVPHVETPAPTAFRLAYTSKDGSDASVLEPVARPGESPDDHREWKWRDTFASIPAGQGSPIPLRTSYRAIAYFSAQDSNRKRKVRRETVPVADSSLDKYATNLFPGARRLNAGARMVGGVKRLSATFAFNDSLGLRPCAVTGRLHKDAHFSLSVKEQPNALVEAFCFNNACRSIVRLMSPWKRSVAVTVGELGKDPPPHLTLSPIGHEDSPPPPKVVIPGNTLRQWRRRGGQCILYSPTEGACSRGTPSCTGPCIVFFDNKWDQSEPPRCSSCEPHDH